MVNTVKDYPVTTISREDIAGYLGDATLASRLTDDHIKQIACWMEEQYMIEGYHNHLRVALYKLFDKMGWEPINLFTSR